ncbi:unnamed protein product [Rotaria magnacalcarata]|uniref:Uncharacterized protein n=1 Tax=Rotaria magnacalcarata TaxID=392030 RepID=A0A816PMW8_9BILA|nr:unnamed protein product [Rotaria magnacalcarata]CAF1666958.1 unnamed protein product [Rotaria magnacalcarata]CAF2050443.1 unnamed protein product [Rotaria magnacalcarata]CAF4315044.1 unnamed protein product [Rotaria magnacalcarata]CAF4346286.1 unnamed protein product [Rotaria magnacalcarata]
MPFLARNVFTLEGHLVPASFCNILSYQTSCVISAKLNLTINDDLEKLWRSHCVPQCKHTYFNNDLSAQSGSSAGIRIQWYELLVNENKTGKVLLSNNFAQNFDYYFN